MRHLAPREWRLRALFFALALALELGLLWWLGRRVVLRGRGLGEGRAFLSPGPAETPDAAGPAEPETAPQEVEVELAEAPATPVPDLAELARALEREALPVAGTVAVPGAAPAAAVSDPVRLAQVQRFKQTWKVRGGGTGIEAEFVCYVARYAGGDWDCDLIRAPDGTIAGGSVPNLIAQVVHWSEGRLRARLVPEPVALDAPELLEQAPPFVYLTGHVDFSWTDGEVANLREYLVRGGCLWADSSLPGRRSRFDMALRREMARTLPDGRWEPLPADDPLYRSWHRLDGPPSGMNFYQEPTEVIRIGRQVAVVYTLNDYGDLWETRLTEQGQIDSRRVALWPGGPLVDQRGPHLSGWDSRFYRNVTAASVGDAHRMGMNVIVHLLTRF